MGPPRGVRTGPWALLPAAALAAPGRARAGAGERAARGLRGEERVARLRDGRDRVAVRRRRRHGDLAGAGAVVQPGDPELGGRVAQRVVLRVGEAGLDLRDHVSRVGLGRGVLAFLLLTEERGQRDRGEDADDQDDDEELDQREAPLVVADVVQHGESSWESGGPSYRSHIGPAPARQEAFATSWTTVVPETGEGRPGGPASRSCRVSVGPTSCRSCSRRP